MKDGKLEVGDVLYFEDYDIMKKCSICKVSRGVAVASNGCKFEVKVFGGASAMITPNAFWRCNLETPELKAKFDKKIMVDRIKNTVHKLDIEKLNKIIEILDEN